MGEIPDRKKILIFVEQPAVSNFISDVLESSGYLTFASITAKKAAGMACEISPDMMICDAQLFRDNKESLSEMSFVNKDMRVMLISSYMDACGDDNGYAGVSARIEKPFGAKELIDNVQRILETDKI